ncbi:hypothetical protein GYMLUDRAFT_163208 [Collybiopsis luxurians FD-317 M1]|uniref:Unplaced genomic scaffold GYMLUscaffold_16, whole genome shotgun sequence n=1 Tax=Collybiopsis luxurians FD-317 M1 TaxID=944289 RepID=A0A0D0CUM6_9AGAR|nr:hypothetical protein GYMLUDRAFT_163208 [Collybiopsis luxurians FD-317 M1]
MANPSYIYQVIRTTNRPKSKNLPPSWSSLAVAGFLASLDQTIVSTSMPTIASHFNALNSQSWIATSYLISSTCFQPVFGRFCDLWGCKLMLLVSIGLFEFGSVLTATAKNFVWLCCGRATAGTLIFVLIAKCVPRIPMVPLRERGRYTGVMFARIALASALGPVLGGVFTTSVSWRWAFYINLPIGGVATLVVLSLWTKIPDSKLASVKVSDIDFVGVIILTASVVALSLSLTWGGVTYPWKSPQVIALLSVGFALIPLFIVYEMKVPEVPIIPMSIFKYRNVVGAATNYFFIHWGLYGLSVYLPTFFQLVKGDDQLISGFELLAYVIPILPMSFTVGILISRTGWVRPYLWSGGAVNLIGTGCCILFTSKTSKAAEFVILIVTGMGIGFVFQANTICGQSQVKRSELASAVTMVTWSRTLGGLFAIPAEGAVIQNIVNRKVEGNSVTAPVSLFVHLTQGRPSFSPSISVYFSLAIHLPYSQRTATSTENHR